MFFVAEYFISVFIVFMVQDILIMAKKTKADALKTRQHLIETAIAQFALRGVANTTLNDIADAADVTAGRHLLAL
ncbi:DNA-binding transcriptional regulator EnvR [Salmonella enterica subsp. enterica serovar Heidelberg str. RI-11-014316]|nr:DNA-binding transcriptional regulator EnvR [Salmonella enterica subsp. enterica serovar Heidelberg str. RI-11-014316]